MPSSNSLTLGIAAALASAVGLWTLPASAQQQAQGFAV